MKQYLFPIVLVALTASAQEVPSPPPPVAEERIPANTKNIVDFPDTEASFKGGKEALAQYIGATVVYPAKSVEDNVMGKVFVSFVVDKKGKVKDPVVMRGADPLLDAEALRVVAKMPKWIPAELHGKNVNTKCTLPIVFRLD